MTLTKKRLGWQLATGNWHSGNCRRTKNMQEIRRRSGDGRRFSFTFTKGRDGTGHSGSIPQGWLSPLRRHYRGKKRRGEGTHSECGSCIEKATQPNQHQRSSEWMWKVKTVKNVDLYILLLSVGWTHQSPLTTTTHSAYFTACSFDSRIAWVE